jgi:hypothetical protein
MGQELATQVAWPPPTVGSSAPADPPCGPELSDEEVLASLKARGQRDDDPPWPCLAAEMLFLTRDRFGVGLVEAAEANHIRWSEALIAWEYVRERARTLCGGSGATPVSVPNVRVLQEGDET